MERVLFVLACHRVRFRTVQKQSNALALNVHLFLDIDDHAHISNKALSLEERLDQRSESEGTALHVELRDESRK